MPARIRTRDLVKRRTEKGEAEGFELQTSSDEEQRKQRAPSLFVCLLALSPHSLFPSMDKPQNLFLDIIRADALKLVRLRHPGVVHVVQGLDVSKAVMAMVTEPIFASVANVLGRVDNIAKVPKELKGLEMGQLEIKHGPLQLAESLGFFHYNARLIHRTISPEIIFITSSGAWKLGGFGFAIIADQVSGDMNSVQDFHYPEYEMLCRCNPP